MRAVVFVISILHIIFLHFIKPSENANILFFAVMGKYSNRLGIYPLLEELANRGHTITLLTNHKTKTPITNQNIIDVSPEILQGFGLGGNVNHFNLRLQNKNSYLRNIYYFHMSLKVCDKILSSPEVLNWIKEKESSRFFDLIIIEGFYCDCGLGLKHTFKIPYIEFIPVLNSWHFDEFGLDPETDWIPLNSANNLPENFSASLYYKIINTLQPILLHLYKIWFYNPELEELIRSRLNISDFSSISQIKQNVGLIFFPTDKFDEYPRTLPPHVVQIGGLHCSAQNKASFLPEELEKFLGSNEFIYVSLGSGVKLSDLPFRITDAFFNTFGNLSDIKFIVKWDEFSEGNRTFQSNVFVKSWMPQRDILKHSNLKAFITHGGLKSLQEALCHGVPLIMFPIFGDQDRNAARAQKQGFGIKLEITTLTQEKLTNALEEILHNDSYKSNVKKLELIYKDRLVEPVDLAVWHVEHLLRHKDQFPFIKSNRIYETWYERRSLDVWAFVFGMICCFFIMGFLIVWKIFQACKRIFLTMKNKGKKYKTK